MHVRKCGRRKGRRDRTENWETQVGGDCVNQARDECSLNQESDHGRDADGGQVQEELWEQNYQDSALAGRWGERERCHK